MTIRHLLLGLIGACLAIGGAPSTAETSEAHAILYEIRSGSGTTPCFLFGTIHSDDRRVVELPEQVREAFAASPGLALEVVPDGPAIIKAMVTMAYTDGRLLRDTLPPDLYREATLALGDLGMSEEAFKDLKPWAVVTLLSAPPSDTGEFLDMLLYRNAVSDGKQIRGLETMAEQLAVFDDLAEPDQIALLRETLAAREHLPAILEGLITAYLERDMAGLKALSESYLAETDPGLAGLFRTVVIDSRNHRMVERMAPLIAQGGWFIAVGALHMSGELGVVELLRRKDYQVSAVF
ncbi:MAG: TraB/GumN family protein [Thiocapsa sp.]|jgi:hypothetical protein|nr:TraB/GumN family protein [Thiocapsa sp.]MCG6895575.1 TraB/GumN family protein [Thiocapsa sp.]MCG6985946.1 TraB/GumN family protein [Thiocapsa sp.]